MRRALKRILKYFLPALLLLLLLTVAFIFGFYAYLQSESGQKWIGGKVSDILGKQFETYVSVGNVDWDFPGIVHIDSVLVKDHKDSTMIFIRKLDAQMGYYNFATGKITISKAELHDVDFNLRRYVGDDKSNMVYLINRLQPEKSTGKKTLLLFKSITLNNADFSWYDYKKPYGAEGIDWDYVDVHDINGRINLFYIEGADFGGKVKQLSFKERSGFELTNLRTRMSYTPTEMEFSNLTLKTPYSEIKNYLQFTYNDPVQFSYFIDSVQIAADFVNSKVSFEDLKYFAPQLQNETSTVALNANVDGTIADMRISELDLRYGDYSFIEGKVNLRGLPQTDELFISARLNDASSSYEELMYIVPEIQLPDQTKKLGKVDLKGNFTGFLNDFVAYGNINTEIGDIKSDINLKTSGNSANTRYSGKLELNSFNLGYFIGEPMLGIISGSGTLAGRGVKLENINAELDANINRFDFNSYSYSNIKVNGALIGEAFQGTLAINDRNADLDFSGKIDFDKPKPELDFIADVRKANLYTLNITRDSLQIRSKLNINIAGIKPDDIEGQIIATDARIRLIGKEYNLDSVLLTSKVLETGREINVYSEILDARLFGEFSVVELPELIKSTANRFIDSNLVNFKTTLVKDQRLDFDVQFRDLDFLLKMFDRSLSLADTGYVKGSITSGDGEVKLAGVIPEFKYKDVHFYNVSFLGNGVDSTLNLDLMAGAIFQKDSMMVRDIKLNTRLSKETILFDLLAADKPLEKKLHLLGDVDIDEGHAVFNLDKSTIIIKDTTWTITARPITYYPDTMVSFPLISFEQGDQRLNVIGKYAKSDRYPIRLILENLELQTIASFVPDVKPFSGDLNGQVLIYNISTTPIIEAAAFVSPLIYEQDTMGILSATASYNQREQKLTIDAGLEDESQQEILNAIGYVLFEDRREKLNLDVNLNRTELALFQPVVDGVFSNLAGYATANLKITGSINEPEFNGTVRIDDGGLTLDYLNTRYYFSHETQFTGKKIPLRKLILLDENNNVGELNGSLTFRSLNNIEVDIRIDADNLLVMNTTSQQNDLFFGKAYGTGYMTLQGPLENLQLYAKMRTEKNTIFSLPISQSSTYSGYDYIRFITKDKYLQEEREVNLSGLQLTMDIEATPDALVQIIFDPRVGDIMEGRGSGSIRMDVSTEGDFNMYGVYTIESGSYRFTAWDIISKDFKINQGSSITWGGDPYEAQLDVDAVYSLNASVEPLRPAVTGRDSGIARTYPVEAKLDLTGALLSPDINLDFEVLGLSGGGLSSDNIDNLGIENQIRLIKSNEQELNKQIVSLLVFNQFQPVTDAANGATQPGLVDDVGAGVSALVSSQLNYWLLPKLLPQRFADDVQFGIDYRTIGSSDLTLRGQLELLNDRVNLGGSYDVATNNYNLLVSYLLNEQGNVRLKSFTRSDNNPFAAEQSSTVGVGIFFRKQFDKLGDLFKREEEEE